MSVKPVSAESIPLPDRKTLYPEPYAALVEGVIQCGYLERLRSTDNSHSLLTR